MGELLYILNYNKKNEAYKFNFYNFYANRLSITGLLLISVPLYPLERFKIMLQTGLHPEFFDEKSKRFLLKDTYTNYRDSSLKNTTYK